MWFVSWQIFQPIQIVAMAFQHAILALFVALVVVPLAQADFQLECPMLPAEECAFAVSFSAHRCVLEKAVGSDLYVCEVPNTVHLLDLNDRLFVPRSD